MPLTLLAIGLAVVIVLGARRYFPQQSAAVWTRIRSVRVILTGLFWLVTALIFLGSGITGLVIAGFLVVLYIAAALVFEFDAREQLERLTP
jgi:hypothetical protein